MQLCAICARPFSVDASRLKWGRGKHCSPECQYESRRRQPKALLHFTCIGCGTSFSRNPSWTRRKGGGKYCSRSCRNKHWKGPLNPNWQTGEKVNVRGPNWHAIRRRIIARDKACQHCGATGHLHVHHEIPYRVFSDKNIANGDWNLIALCPSCHRKEESRRKWVSLSEGVLCFNSGGYACQLAKERGMT